MIDEVPTFRDWLNSDRDIEVAMEFKTSHKINREKLMQIRKELKGMKTIKQVAIDCGVPYMTVYNIYKKRTFKED